MSKDTAFNGETTPRHTILCSDSQCLPPGDPKSLCAKHGYPITGKSFIRKGILHRDVAHLFRMFVIAMLPITGILHEYEAGYQLSKEEDKVNHLMILDDSKMYGRKI